MSRSWPPTAHCLTATSSTRSQRLPLPFGTTPRQKAQATGFHERLALAGRQRSNELTERVSRLTSTLADPPQRLTFALSNAPAGAAINASNGVLTWRPAMSQAGTNVLAVVVTDSGSPSLSATQDYNVVVSLPPSPGFQSVGFSDSVFSLVVTGAYGPDYSIEACTNLTGRGNWTTLLTTNAPSLPFFWEDIDAANLGERYYRVRLGP